MVTQKCSFDEEKLIGAAYGDGGIAGRFRVYLHRIKCPECASLYREYKQTAERFDSIKPEKCPATVTDRVDERIGISSKGKKKYLTRSLDFIFYRPAFSLSGTIAVVLLAFILTYQFTGIFDPDPGVYYSEEEIRQAQEDLEKAFAMIVPVVQNAQITVRDNIIRSQLLPPVKQSVEQTNLFFRFDQ
jgi:hypothetical protein